MRIFIIPLFLMILSTPLVVQAEQLDRESFAKEGFGQIADIYNSMTPEQRKDVMKAAKRMEAQLRAMPEKDRQNLIASLRQALSFMDVSTLKLNQLDTSVAKDLTLEKIQNDLETFNK